MRIAKCSQCPKVFKGKYANIQLANHRRFKHAPSNGAVPVKVATTTINDLIMDLTQLQILRSKVAAIEKRIESIKVL